MSLGHLADGIVDPVSQRYAEIAISGLTADSREVLPGFVFAALAGTQADGARYIADAVSRGAAAVLAGPGTTIADARVPLLQAANPRRALALMAARFFALQPSVGVAVTGTNGKTSVTSFVRQIWEIMGFGAASLGTVGVVSPAGKRTLGHTTPDPVQLHRMLAELVEEGVTHVALEASSHGLAQARLDGLRLAAGAFTNLTRDHLDYHPTFEDYASAKLRLFTEVLEPPAVAIINADSEAAPQFVDAARHRGLIVHTVGARGEHLRLLGQQRDGLGQQLRIGTGHAVHEVYLPLAGTFQTSNALIAAGLVIGAGGDETVAIRALESLKGASGRLELVATTANGAPVFVDYAHTPDALETVLETLKPYAGGRLKVVFGCGGDRDRGKRPEMGAIAARLADEAYVTDDNPRGEDPATIRAAILAACPGGIEIGDRAEAIFAAIRGLKSGDVLVVAGKGHETGQIVGKEVLPFSDQDVVRAAVEGRPKP
ncbi:MAG: UDP-N-acetylmuramoyl-L-alanyl-D-glutamate--2,6-diaminopimelate ligase [Aestuariivirgaceae bacterium]